jgi:hypothetical protein
VGAAVGAGALAGTRLAPLAWAPSDGDVLALLHFVNAAMGASARELTLGGFAVPHVAARADDEPLAAAAAAAAALAAGDDADAEALQEAERAENAREEEEEAAALEALSAFGGAALADGERVALLAAARGAAVEAREAELRAAKAFAVLRPLALLAAACPGSAGLGSLVVRR